MIIEEGAFGRMGVAPGMNPAPNEQIEVAVSIIVEKGSLHAETRIVDAKCGGAF